MSKHASTFDLADVKPFAIPAAVRTFFVVAAVVGAGIFVLGAFRAPERAWPNFLVNYFYFLVLGLAGAFFVALQHITNAYWSVTVRRLAESLISYLPVALLLAAVLFTGRQYIYSWAHVNGGGEGHNLLALKAPYLNSKFFAMRLIVIFVLWLALSLKMRSNSLKQDTSGDERLTLSNIKLSAAFLPLFGLTFTAFSFDLIMSLEPTWYSTIFGIYCFAGLFFGGLALLALMGVYGRRIGVFSDRVLNRNHLHDVGKLMFAFTVFWAYIMFSQLMLQWYANLPEETQYYMRRFHGGWWPYAIVLFALHFVVPFFALLPREAKRKERSLGIMAILMLIAQWMEAYFLVMPVFFPEGPRFGWIEAGTLLGFLGIFALSVTTFLSRVPCVPVRDPRLRECLSHSQ